MSERPVALQRDGNTRRLIVEWSDGLRQAIPFRILRDNCPCAVCRTAKKPDDPAQAALRVLSPAEMQPLDIDRMVPVGNYAYHIEFTDGHTSGIYTFDLLRSLGEDGGAARE